MPAASTAGRQGKSRWPLARGPVIGAKSAHRMAPMDTIRHLASLRGRWPGSEGEREGAEYVADQVRQLGRKATLEPVSVRPSYALTYAIHAALAVVGSVVAVYTPPLGVVILLLVSLSMFGDLTARFHLLRRLMARRWSRNVTSPGTNPAASATVVLTAHHDSARSGIDLRPPPTAASPPAPASKPGGTDRPRVLDHDRRARDGGLADARRLRRRRGHCPHHRAVHRDRGTDGGVHALHRHRAVRARPGSERQRLGSGLPCWRWGAGWTRTRRPT